MALGKYCFKLKRNEVPEKNTTAQLLVDESKPDVTLLCEGTSLKAHRTVLTAYSQLFQQRLSADPNLDTVVIPKDVSGADLTKLVEFMYRGEVTLPTQNLFSLLKAVETLRMDGRCTFVLDKGVTEEPSSSNSTCQMYFAVHCEACEMPRDSVSCHITSEAESNDSADKRIAFDSGVGNCEATENVEDSSLQSVTVSARPDETTQNSPASVEPTSAITEQASLPALAVVETESEGNSRNSDLELSRASTVPDAPASNETSAAAAPSLDALLCEAFSSLTIGSEPYSSLKEIRMSTNFMKGSQVEQIVIGAEARDTSTVVPDMSVAAGDTEQQSRDAGNHDLAPCADSARSSSCEEGSSSGASNYALCPIITQPRKRTAAKRKAPTASTEELADGRPYSGPITRSRAARMAKQ